MLYTVNKSYIFTATCHLSIYEEVVSTNEAEGRKHDYSLFLAQIGGMRIMTHNKKQACMRIDVVVSGRHAHYHTTTSRRANE